MTFKKQSFGDKIFEISIAVFLLVFTVIIAYPVVWIIASSFSEPFPVLSGQVYLLPVEPTLRMYKIVFSNPDIPRAYLNTVVYTVLGTTVSVTLSALCAYPLSRQDFFGKRVFTGILLFTMFVHGGMIPNFLLVRNLKMLDTIWAIIIPGSVSVYNVIVMRTFYAANIPTELEDSAFLDGANDLQFFVKCVIPLSKAIVAVMVLMYGVVHWNSWFHAFLYTTSRKMFPMALILREIILQGNAQNNTADNEFVGDCVRYATMVVATLPIMCLYPFLQKYFTKGVMVGSLKG